MHPRLSVHSVSFLGASLDELDGYWQRLGLRRLSLIAQQLDGDGTAVVCRLIERRGYAVEAVTHVFATGALPTGADAISRCRDALLRTVDNAERVGAKTIYMISGGRGDLTWRLAAELFAETLAPCVRRAEQAGVALAVENASNLYVDVHLAHTLRDTITLAEMAGIGICLDHFHCWTEADFPDLVARALPLVRLVQLSDYVLGDRALPARAVPGDGAVPIAPFLEQVLAGGYAGGFDLELLGPRIESEGRFVAVARACDAVRTLLDGLGA
jgi:sugar phosphate isomerase/epimerase